MRFKAFLVCAGIVASMLVAQPATALPSRFQWRSSAQLIAPKSDATHNIRAVKDPSVVYHNGRWHVFASTVNTAGSYSMVYVDYSALKVRA